MGFQTLGFYENKRLGNGNRLLRREKAPRKDTS